MSNSSKIIRLTPFDELTFHHIQPILNQEKHEWETILEWRFRPVIDAFRSMFESRILPGMAVMQGSTCQGYIYYMVRALRCVIGGLYFTPKFRESEWPRLALEKILHQIAMVSPTEAIEGQISFPGPEKSLAPFLKERGFSMVRRSFMRLESLLDTETESPHRELTLHSLNYAQIDAMALLMARCYHDHLDRNVSSLYGNFNGCSFLLSQLILKDGCGPMQPWCSFMARIRDEPAGVMVISRISPESFFISQVFVHPKYQGLGVGRYLVGASINRIVHRVPKAHLALTVSTENTMAFNWYQRMGFCEVLPHYAFKLDISKT